MKIRAILLLVVCLSLLQLVNAQNINDPFKTRDEIYFSFSVGSKDELKSISRQISIDNFRNDTVWAYANSRQFNRFSALGYKINFLPHPGDGPGVIMRDQIKMLKGTKTTWNFYPTYDAYETLMNNFQAMYPTLCHLETITTLSSGRKIIVAKISDNVSTNEAEPEFLYTSSMHGDETTGYVLMLQLIEYLLQNYGTNSEVTSLVNNMEIYINPLANPDGTYYGGNSSVSGARRYNINGVDLNRNYPDPEDGDHPDGEAWQPETVAFMNFASQHDFVASANFHGGVEVVNYPWDTWSTRSADDNWWQYVSREYADTVHLHAVSGYMTYLDNGITNGYDWYEVAGGRQDYMNYFHHCREFTVEISNTKLLPSAQLPAHWNYNHRSFILFMKQATYGFRGLITDQVTGSPVEAKVTLVGHDALNTEVYSTALHGDYYRPVKAGTYTIEVSAPCYNTQTFTDVTISDYSSLLLNVQLLYGAGVSTSPVTSITTTSAVSGGEILCNGSSPISSRGVCWGTTINPLVNGPHSIDGSGNGTFVSNITGLSASTNYYVRAYATNAQGTVYGENIQFATGCGTTTLPFAENFTGADFPACWTTSVSGTGTIHNWSVSNTTNAGGTAREMKSTYQNINPATSRLVTPPINTTGQSQLNLSFRHMLDAYATGVTLKIQSSTDGVNWTDEVWSVAATSSNIPATLVSTTVTHNLNSPGTLIAFTVTGNLYQYDYWYVDNVTITGTVSNLPLVTTSVITSVTASSAVSGGVVTSGGSSGVTARGVCYGTVSNPDIIGDHTTDGSGTGSFTSSLEGLSAATTYYVRAYATNGSGTAYGNELTFSTSCGTIYPFAWMENFENGGALPTCWTQEMVNSSGVSWSFITGNGSGHPTVAHSGIYNACLKDNSSADNKTRLISPTLDLSSLLNPILTFWHTQADWSGDQDQLTLLYKTSAAGNWITLATYTANITTWTQETIMLPGGTSEYYIAFEGNAKYGYGVCLDDVSVSGSTPALFVSPMVQNVGAAAGEAIYGVFSNTNWSASSNQTWCNVTPAGSYNGQITAVYEANTGDSPREAVITVTAPGTLPFVVSLSQEAALEKTLNLTVFIEGLFNGTDMDKAQNETGSQYPGSIADEITVEFHSAIAPYDLVGQSYIVGINTDGTAQLSIPASMNSSYYIVIKHRNSIETWNHDPISFNTATVSYNFTDAASKAFGNNLKPVAGKYVIFGGDVNQDGQVDLADMTPLDNDAGNFMSGYLNTDVNGDGSIDIADMTILDNNSSAFVGLIAP